jgi:hypothetical protein
MSGASLSPQHTLEVRQNAFTQRHVQPLDTRPLLPHARGIEGRFSISFYRNAVSTQHDDLILMDAAPHASITRRLAIDSANRIN